MTDAFKLLVDAITQHPNAQAYLGELTEILTDPDTDEDEALADLHDLFSQIVAEEPVQ